MPGNLLPLSLTHEKIPMENRADLPNWEEDRHAASSVFGIIDSLEGLVEKSLTNQLFVQSPQCLCIAPIRGIFSHLFVWYTWHFLSTEPESPTIRILSVQLCQKDFSPNLPLRDGSKAAWRIVERPDSSVLYPGPLFLDFLSVEILTWSADKS